MTYDSYIRRSSRCPYTRSECGCIRSSDRKAESRSAGHRRCTAHTIHHPVTRSCHRGRLHGTRYKDGGELKTLHCPPSIVNLVTFCRITAYLGITAHVSVAKTQSCFGCINSYTCAFGTFIVISFVICVRCPGAGLRAVPGGWWRPPAARAPAQAHL